MLLEGYLKSRSSVDHLLSGAGRRKMPASYESRDLMTESGTTEEILPTVSGRVGKAISPETKQMLEQAVEIVRLAGGKPVATSVLMEELKKRGIKNPGSISNITKKLERDGRLLNIPRTGWTLA